jgi:hypothetical protein
MNTSISLSDQEGTEYEVEIDFDADYTPANSNGHPDNWTPAEGDSSCKIISISLNGVDTTDTIPPEIREELDSLAEEWVAENGVEYINEYNEECKAEAMIDAMDDFDDPRDDYAWDGPY